MERHQFIVNAGDRVVPQQTDLLDADRPVVLIEGRRHLPAELVRGLQHIGSRLASTYPQALFRSGNAEGSDTAFAEGVTRIDPLRMQYVLPSPNMGRKRRHPDSLCYSLLQIPNAEIQELCDITIAASPGAARLAEAASGRIRSGPLAGKGRYLLRDTLKVVGSPALGLPPASLALFYVDLTDPEAGGTGHTIRVCRKHGVRVCFQNEFMHWFPPN